MKKSLIVATLAVLLSVNVLTPISYATGDLSENEGGMTENGSGMTENNPENGGEGGDDVLLGGKEVAPTGSGTEDFYESEESSKNPQSGENLDSSVTPQNDGNDEQDFYPTSEASLDAQNDNQDDTANPEDLLAMPMAVPMQQQQQSEQNPDQQEEEPVNPEADPNSDPATPDEDSDDASSTIRPSYSVGDLHIYFLDGDGAVTHHTIADRNLGATKVGMGPESYGHYFQWGNNYGFTLPITNYTADKVPYEVWLAGTPSKYFSGTFVKQSNWQKGTDDKLFNNNQWGGADDKIDQNGSGTKAHRQGPCPTNYYVPSAHDFAVVLESWIQSSPDYNFSEEYEPYDPPKYYHGKDSEGDTGKYGKHPEHAKYYNEFAADLLLPLAGYINYSDLGIVDNGVGGHYWASSPPFGPKHQNPKDEYKDKANSRRLTLKADQFDVGAVNRGNGMSVRCFKTTNPDFITINPNGGEKAVIVVGGNKHIYTLDEPEHPDGKEFKGWYTTENFLKGTNVEKGNTLDSSVKNLYARWSDVEESVIVTFVNEDGTELQSGAVLSGTTLTNEAYTGATPTKEATAQYTYTFAGWTPEFAPLTDHTTYTAKFDEIVNKYKIKFVDEDGTTVLKEATEYDYGTPASDIIRPSDPTKAATAEWTYTFSGWTPEVVAVTGDATYTATFSQTKNSYTITWKNDDGSVIDTTTVEYGVVPTHADATKAATAEWTYTFSGWTPEVVAVTGDATYTATFSQTKNSYTITWLNDDDTQIDTTTVEYGVVPTHADATKTATAEYTYTFSGWTPEVVAVTGEATYKATFSSTKNKYKVTFKDADGNVILEEEIEYGQTPTAPADPTKEGHTFSGWSPAIGPVTGPINYEPTFDINKHTVIWQNYDGTELKKDENVEYGTTPTYDGATPTRDADAQYTYTFAAWSPAISTVKGDVVYKATYSTTVKEYPVTFLDEDGTELYKYNVPYGMMPLYTGDIPTKEADSKYTYTFAGWTPSLAAVTGDATYTVKFNSKKKGGKRSGGGKGGNSDSEPTHGSADDERPQDYPDTPADTPVDEPKGEIFDVHKWAYENGLTKFEDINDARMNDPITRSEMAKISSIFDTNFLGKTPDESKESECSSYQDIQNMGGDLYYFVVQSCELKNMGYHYDNENHIENFMPYNPLNVAQASVILSRMAWGKKYIIGPEKWYQGHMYAVYEHVLIDDTSDPWRHITRREAFTAFYRLDKLLKEKK